MLPPSLFSASPCCLTVGNFDGVHLGHRRMVEELVAMAQKQGTRAIAVTFDPPPLRLLAPERCPPQLTTLARRQSLLLAAGADEVVVLPTTPELLQMTAEEFVESILLQQLKAVGIVEGPNFRFGRGRVGDVHTLRSLCAGRLPLTVVDAVETDSGMISSSLIRTAIQSSQIATARKMLGRPFEIQGVVGTGAQRGRTIGFPTANLEAIETLLPPPGVYAGRARVHGVPYTVALHIGPNPTFGEGALKVEAHLIGYQGNLYGTELVIELLDQLRGVVRFSCVESLIDQLRKDVAQAQAILAGDAA
ncbi:MAG: riboflavin biosynthesis protein RibF [Planctomycetota bacterium]|nr:MAG: riboflavin biosynthesis protein RibF [Planctomycetota bacterium]